MKKLIIIAIFAQFILCSCSSSTDSSATSTSYSTDAPIFSKSLELKKKKIAKLNENIHLLGQIASFHFIDKNAFIVSSKQSGDLVIYNISGQQIRVINKLGNGPEEYGRPGIVRSYKGDIYVWDDNRLNMVVYDTLGNHLRTFSNIDFAIKNFIPHDSGFFLYMSGGGNDLIRSYNSNIGELDGNIGKVEEEHKVLSINEKSGGLLIHDEKLLFTSTCELALNSYDMVNEDLQKIYFKDDDFIVGDIADGVSFFNSSRREAMEYLMKNSYIRGLYKREKDLILVAQIGELKRKNQAIDFSDRFIKYYLIDYDLTLKGTFKDGFNPDKEFLYSNSEIGLMGLKFSNQIEAYELYELEFN